MSVPDLNQTLTNESGRIGTEIYRRSMHDSIWNTIVPVDWFDKKMGDTIRALTMERSLPATEPVWSPVRFNNDSNTCVPDAALITPAQTLREYGLDRTAVESARICVDDARATFEVEQQIEAVVENLTEQVSFIWEKRKRDEYVRLSENKIIFDDALARGTASFPTTPALYGLSQGVLDRVHQELTRNGGWRNPMSRDNNQPVYGLITSSETSDRIMREDPAIRTDFRESSRSDELLSALGINRVYRGFAHMIDLFPNRYNFVDGAWVRVAPYITVATTKGDRAIPNPAWEVAEFEDSIVFHEEVYKCLYPQTVGTLAGGASFEEGPETYRGDYKWKNFDIPENPDQTWGFWRGVLTQASKPVKPDYGFVIRHKRCFTDLAKVVCS
jgi:hypothetical protein